MILLITSRDTGRWIIPKGWPERKVKPHELAAREAYEEAGLIGRVGQEPCGTFRYEKRLSNGRARTCEVQVFPLEVERELEEWPEKGQRARRWVSPDEAAAMVDDGGLADLLRVVELRV